ncbi:Bacterial type II and III secretion system protein [Pseudobythopirellula maris]|uniref:Bacterial type II and III secretion system protein n=2 Tax=Pseudobythopirellula maris TaxID=2527991 RepID=A0A5C5ZHE9_9BACT|nr:Bacterial type II and III secretion system protein [Pseudobythopirellula maris]
MDFGAFCRLLADKADVSIVVEQSLEYKTITMEVDQQPVDDVLAFAARRIDADVRLKGDLYFVGSLRPQDRGILVRRVRRLTKEQVNEALTVFASSEGRAASFTDGLVVVGDTVEVLTRVAEMLDMVESAESPVWVVQLHLVSYSTSAADQLGVNLEPAAKAGLAFAAGSAAGGAGASWQLAASLDAILQVAYTRDDVGISAAPMFLVSDGETSRFVQGDRVPLPRRSTSPEGTVTTEGYDYVQTGVQVELTLRETGERSAKIDLDLAMSDIKELVNGEAPVTGEESFVTTSIVQAGGVYLLGTLAKDRLQDRRELGLATGHDQTAAFQVLQVWLQCYRIGGPVAGPHRKPTRPRSLGPAVSARGNEGEPPNRQSKGPAQAKPPVAPRPAPVEPGWYPSTAARRDARGSDSAAQGPLVFHR